MHVKRTLHVVRGMGRTTRPNVLSHLFDEFSLLTKAYFERMMKLWQVAERVPTLVFLGDKYQMPGMGNERPWHSAAWTKQCKHSTLHKMWRCKDKSFASILDTLRVRKPKKKLLHEICRHHKGWSTKDPTTEDIKKLFETVPKTKILTCTKKGERIANDTAMDAIFGNRKRPVILEGDPEQNPDNYDVDRKWRKDRKPRPSKVKIFKKMKGVLRRT